MQKAVLGFIVILLSGCGGGSGFSSFFSPSHDESSVPVIYPAEQVGSSPSLSMVQSYGKSWEDVRVEYPEYSFN